MRLFIAEKPKAGQAIASCLSGRAENKRTHIVVGNSVVSWCFGHLLELKDAKEYDDKFSSWSADLLPIFPEKMVVRPPLNKDGDYKRKQIALLRSLIKDATEVVNAGDDDREGHLLVMQVLEHLGYRGPVKRMRFSGFDQAGVRKALAGMEDNRKFATLLESGKARSEADWLVGINLTRAFTSAFRKHGSDRLVTVGRVQTPTLAMVVERDLLIENFIPTEYYEPKILVEKDGIQFAMSWIPPSKDAGFDADGRLIDPELAKRAALPKSVTEVFVKDVKTTAKREGPPALFRLATIQGACSAKLGLDASVTLKVIQDLYEKHQILSYPRTSCSHLEESFHAESEDLFNSIRGLVDPSVAAFIDKADFSLRSSAFNDKKVEAHHAIIPVRPPAGASRDRLSEVERNVFEMVVERFLCHFYPDHEYNSTHVIANHSSGREFEARGKVPTQMGWRQVVAGVEDDVDNAEGDGEEGAPLPVMANGDSLAVLKSGIERKKTRPPKRYTSGSLMLDLENVHRVVERRAKLHGEAAVLKLKPIIAKLKSVAGIGTDATRAKMVDGLISHSYLEKKKSHLISTPLGREVIRNLPEQIASPVMTALFEQALGSIVDGSLTRDQFMAQQQKWIVGALDFAMTKPMKVSPHKNEKYKKKTGEKVADDNAKACTVCSVGVMRERKGAKGPFLGCSKYPECKHTEQISAGNNEKGNVSDSSSGLDGAAKLCSACGGVMRLRNSAKGQFYGCSKYPVCKHTEKAVAVNDVDDR